MFRAMKTTPEELVEELREAAELSNRLANEGNEPLKAVMVVPDFLIEDTTEWEAADLIEAWHRSLKSIAEGAPDPVGIAKDALA